MKMNANIMIVKDEGKIYLNENLQNLEELLWCYFLKLELLTKQQKYYKYVRIK